MYQLSHLVKQKKLDLPLIESIVKTLYYGTGLSATVLDRHHNKLIGQGPSSNVDELFEDIFDTFDPFIKDICNNHGNGIFTYDSSYELSYLTAVIADQSNYYGALLLGPFLTKEADEHLINEVMHDKRFSMSKRDHLKTMYNDVPVLNTSRTYYVQQLLVSTITNPSLTELYPHSQIDNLSGDFVDTYVQEIELEKKVIIIMHLNYFS